MTAYAAVAAIGLYQQFLSPYKGFRCAHRARHGRTSCSQFAKRLIQKVGLLRFFPMFRERLRRCGRAAQALRARSAARREERMARKHARRRSSFLDGCDPTPCDVGGCDVPDVTGVADGCDCGGCDLSL